MERVSSSGRLEGIRIAPEGRLRLLRNCLGGVPPFSMPDLRPRRKGFVKAPRRHSPHLGATVYAQPLTRSVYAKTVSSCSTCAAADSVFALEHDLERVGLGRGAEGVIRFERLVEREVMRRKRSRIEAPLRSAGAAAAS